MNKIRDYMSNLIKSDKENILKQLSIYEDTSHKDYDSALRLRVMRTAIIKFWIIPFFS